MSRTRHHIIAATMSVAALFLCASPLIAKDNARLTALAKIIAKLRGEVDDQYQQLALDQRTAAAQVTALNAELEGLKMQVSRAQARSTSLEKLVRARRATLKARRGDKDALRASLRRSCQELRGSIVHTAPLHRQARLAKLDALCIRLKSGAITAAQGLEQLVTLTHDEIQLGRTTQLTRQRLIIDGKPRLVPVVALGTALMYWKLEDGRVGVVAQRGKKWVSIPLEAPAARTAIGMLHQAERTSSQNTIIALPIPESSSLGSRP